LGVVGRILGVVCAWKYISPIDSFEDDIFEEKSSFFHSGEDEEPEVEFESTLSVTLL